MAGTLVELFRHNLWANLELFDACASLDDARLDATAPGVFGSIRTTLRHIVVNEERYLAALEQGPLPAGNPAAPMPSLAELRARVQASGEGLIAVASQGLDAQVLRGEFNGQPYTMPAAVPLIQAINHATEHRAQIATVLTLQGVEPPALDGWRFWEQGQIAAGESTAAG
jgi:uncharacterized damage-inducible protein DinB